VARYRFGTSWPETVLRGYLKELETLPVNFEVPPEQMTEEHGWTIDGSKALLGTEAPGPPVEDSLFLRARQGLINYDFSDPRIAVGHFDPTRPFVGRNMLLEIKVLGWRFLSGVRVHSVEDVSSETSTNFGFRYDTLEGHIEQGYEWFTLVKDHASGSVYFQIEAHWRMGEFPNWWSKLGFRLFGERYRTVWRHRAPERLRELARRPVSKPLAVPGHLAHRGDETPQRTEPPKAA
jgi:uncharacterized protein (UPF0548 family)